MTSEPPCPACLTGRYLFILNVDVYVFVYVDPDYDFVPLCYSIFGLVRLSVVYLFWKNAGANADIFIVCFMLTSTATSSKRVSRSLRQYSEWWV
jgi:hypothetical protein